MLFVNTAISVPSVAIIGLTVVHNISNVQGRFEAGNKLSFI